MKPYYEDGAVSLYHGDCREVLPTLANWSVDLIVTDPPYGQDWQSNRRNSRLDRIAGDNAGANELTYEALSACLGRTAPLRNRRHLYIFGRPDLSDLPIGASVELVWDKEILGPGDLSLPWGPAHEPITFAVHTSRPSDRAKGDGRLAARLRQGSVIRGLRRSGGQLDDTHVRHATEKPVGLLRQLIESSSLLGEMVLDPFVGSGSTLVAARQEGRRAIGIEADESYCEVAAKRLAQGSLFEGGAA